MKRRDLILAGGALLAAGGLPPAVLATGLCRRTADLRARFAACLGSEFRVTDAAGRESLLRLTALDEETYCARTEQFSLVWEGAAAGPAAAGTYLLRHPRAGEHLLYLEPGPAAGGQTRLRAQFSLLS